MKLFYLTNTIYNSAGMEKILLSKANFLSTQYGHEVVIVTNHQKGRPTFFPLDPSVRHIDLDINTHFPWNRPRYMAKLEALVERERPDIVISLCCQELPYLPHMRGDCVKMAEFHFSHETYAIKGQERKLRTLEKAVGQLDCFVVLTQEDMAAWAPHCGKGKLAQIYNFIPRPAQEEGLAPLEATRCISGGRFDKQKNYGEMIRAWKIVHERHPAWTLDLYGSGNKQREIQSLIRREGLQDTIFLHPPVKDLQAQMRKSSVYLMTSLYEGFPLVLLEAAMVGLPCVCHRCPCGPAECITDGTDGFLTQQGDIEGMAENICTLIEQPQLRREMGVRFHQKADQFTPEAIMPRWDALLRSLAAKRGTL